MGLAALRESGDSHKAINSARSPFGTSGEEWHITGGSPPHWAFPQEF
jgi:hypothetical protein